MRRARLILRALTVLVAIPFFYLVFGLVGGLIPGPVEQTPEVAGDVRIGLARGPIHYDLLLPNDADLRARFAFAEAAGVPLSNPEARWLMVGWGADEFYTRTGEYGDIAFGPVLHAITGDASVMRLDAVGPVDGVQGVRFLTITQGQYAALLDGIDASFLRNVDGAPMAADATGFGLTDAFFMAKGKFNIFYTCNAWVGTQLRAAGVPMGVWTPTPQSIDVSLWRIGLGG
jgi:uncharacterized protein (TIGR02117 family)